MDKKNNKGKVIMITVIPGAVAFVVLAILISMVALGVLSAVAAIVILLILSAAVVGLLMKILTGMVGCFSDVSSNIEKFAEGSAEMDLKSHVKNEATREMIEKVEKLLKDFAKVTTGVKDATEHLGEVVTDFQESFEEMSAMSENIHSETGKIYDNAQNQAGMTEDVIQKIGYLGTSIDTIAGQIGDLTVSADNMKDCNQTADSIMQDLVEISRENGEAVENINRQTEITNQSVQEIMEAVDIIASIAGQTNLLALNASIEAARAGEQGRGFAVVAEEIGQLAEQSKSSSARIGDVVNSLIQNSNESVNITKQLADAFEAQKVKIHETEEIFGKLNTEVETVSNAIVEIDKEAGSAKEYGDSMHGQIVALKETVDSNTASVENTVSELDGFEKVVDKCMKATASIGDVSEELVGYVSVISEKKEEFNGRAASVK